jgi:hypothetical protein
MGPKEATSLCLILILVGTRVPRHTLLVVRDSETCPSLKPSELRTRKQRKGEVLSEDQFSPCFAKEGICLYQ